MTPKDRFLLLLLVLAAFSSVILPWLRQRIAAQMPREIEPEALEAPRQVKRPPVSPARAPSMYREGPRRVPLPAVAPPGATRRRARWPVRSLGDARRGIVLMTLVGPCRALEPSDAASK